MKKYRVTFVIQTESHPRKWISEALAPNLHDDEEIIEYDIELVEDDTEQ